MLNHISKIAFRNNSLKSIFCFSNIFLQGGIFTLSPEEAAIVRNGGIIEDSFFPEGFVSLVSSKFSYLLGLPNHVCIASREEYGDRYDGGILCAVELRALKVYTRGLLSGSAPQLRVEVWFNNGGIAGQTGSPESSQLINFHQVGADFSSPKQGYSLPVIPGRDHSYKLSLTNGNLPDDWVIEFSDPVIGNRWSRDELFLGVAGRDCGNNGLIDSQHDRKFIWGGNGYLDDEAWFHHGACVGSGNPPPEEPFVDCNAQNSNTRTSHDTIDQPSSRAGIIQATECPGECSGGCDTTNSYCDCGSKTCNCRAGFAGPTCEIDLCKDADCGEHGACAMRYLGGALPVSQNKCVCEEGWQGEKCDKNPCVQLGLDCSGRGTCLALSDTQATCVCPDGYFGPYCEIRSPCEGFCQGGEFPYFGCGSNISNKVALGCFRTGGCYYLSEGQEYPYDGFCTYKTYETNMVFSTEDVSPTPAPIERPTTPSPVPTTMNPPALDSERCGCDTCTDEVWETLANGYTCGSRISFIRDSDVETLLGVGITTGPFDEEGACRFVTNEFPEVCPCHCADSDTSEPTASSSNVPTLVMSGEPSTQPSDVPTFVISSEPSTDPSNAPTESSIAHCGCEKCSEEVWNTFADGYKCGDRIAFVRDSDESTLLSIGIVHGPFDEAGACRFVSEEFPDICTCLCDDEPTLLPTPSSPTLCGCEACTDQVWNTNVDGYSCGDRISFLRDSDNDTLLSLGITNGPFDEGEACQYVSEEFPNICTCFCNGEDAIFV